MTNLKDIVEDGAMTPHEKAKNIVDIDGDERMAWRARIESTGGSVAGHDGPYMLVKIARGQFGALLEAGFTLRDGSLHFFPLGSDPAPEHLRHDGNYPGSRGFWLYGQFALPTERTR